MIRRTNTDYKFNEENSKKHYLSTNSLKSNDNNDKTIYPNLEFNYYFDHSCRVGDHDICHKAILSNTYESGIGSSISSIDAHCSIVDEGTGDESSADIVDFDQGLHLGHWDYHDSLPPVTEEEDNDSMINIFNGFEEENKHLDYLPWRHNEFLGSRSVILLDDFPGVIEEQSRTSLSNVKMCKHWLDCCKVDESSACSLYFIPVENGTCDNHIERPWLSLSNEICNNSAHAHNPVLSSICHKSDDCLRKSKNFPFHFTHINLISDKAIMYKVFKKRHMFINGSSLFNYNIRSLINVMDNNDDFVLQHSSN